VGSAQRQIALSAGNPDARTSVRETRTAVLALQRTGSLTVIENGARSQLCMGTRLRVFLTSEQGCILL
ncbi:MAG: hypothetical protein ACREPR_11085, partial [Brasilonema sp.]